MALEKSGLTGDAMRNLLASEFGFHLIESNPLSFGSANCFKIRCKEGIFFLKEYQRSFSLQDVEKEATLVTFLFSKCFPVARFFKTVNGNLCTIHDGHIKALIPHVKAPPFLSAGASTSCGFDTRLYSGSVRTFPRFPTVCNARKSKGK